MTLPVGELLILRYAVRVDVSIALHACSREPDDAFVEVDAGRKDRQPDLRIDVDLRKLDREVILVDRSVGVVVLPVPKLLNVIDVHSELLPGRRRLLGRSESLPQARSGQARGPISPALPRS